MSRIQTPEDLRRVMKTKWTATDQQWEAITAPLAPRVVIAGAGSGKTTLMAARVVYLVANGLVRPDQILGLTFTTKAARELEDRVREALETSGLLEQLRNEADEDEEEPLDPTVSTYHAYAAHLLDEHGLRIGHEPDARVLADASRYQVAARVIARYTDPVQELTDHPETAIQNILTLDSAMSEHLVGVDDVVEFDAAERRKFHNAVLAEVAGKNRSTYVKPSQAGISAIDRRAELLGLVRAYRRTKSDLGLMDFSDQIELAARLAREHPAVGEGQRDQYRVVLLDEYQDTSVAQALMLSSLFSGPASSGRGHAVMGVGDPNQAIYGWRGASVSNIINFHDFFPLADGSHPAVLNLSVNQRSDRRILDVANAVAKPLYDATTDVEPLVASPRADVGSVRTPVFDHRRDELEWLAGEVRASHERMAEPAWNNVAVLTRDNQHAAEVFDALTLAEIPVEIVGLSGLLRLPEVAEVLSTLQIVNDLTNNSALLTLLNGPRWAIGPRDLKLLGQRSMEMSGGRAGRSDEAVDLRGALEAAVAGTDLVDVPALMDALEDPGELAYSPEAKRRFVALAGELRYLRRFSSEPLLDLLRRIIDTTGVDIELASATTETARARRDNLDLFVKAVADFQAIDGDTSLNALLAYLTAEDEFGNGLDIATPTPADSVKLLTVHRAKGLEWHAVFVVGVSAKRFPSGNSRSLWYTTPAALPSPLRGDAADIPQLGGHDKQATGDHRTAVKAYDLTEETRLAYVAFTRAKRELFVSSYVWNYQKTWYGPSEFQRTVRDQLESMGVETDAWPEMPEKGTPNPHSTEEQPVPWPGTRDNGEVLRRRQAAQAVAEAAALSSPDPDLSDDEAELVAEWDEALTALIAEARAETSTERYVDLPSSMSATALARVRDDPEAFARDLVRPMPRQPAPAAAFGTRFHAWVESRYQEQGLFAPDELPGSDDRGITSDTELDELIKAFEEGPFADRHPTAVEARFSLVLAGQVLRGAIDAVFTEGEEYLVVDWKTGHFESADPLQLALYRLAWAELKGVPVERVRAAFYYVRSGNLEEVSDLPDRASLEEMLATPAPQ